MLVPDIIHPCREPTEGAAKGRALNRRFQPRPAMEPFQPGIPVPGRHGAVTRDSRGAPIGYLDVPKGFRTVSPRLSKSPTLRVTTVS